VESPRGKFDADDHYDNTVTNTLKAELDATTRADATGRRVRPT